tara:strand:- start:303 stop:590 length:288 start_codon:yes stop_codon:yes gene_type:complete
MKKLNFTPGDLVVRKSIPESEYGIVVEEMQLDTWARSKDAMEIQDFRNMNDSAVRVIWFWCTDEFSNYAIPRHGNRLHKSWELASRLVKAEDAKE